MYVPCMFQLCCGPLCGDPEKTPYPAGVALPCLGVCRHVHFKHIIVIQKQNTERTAARSVRNASVFAIFCTRGRTFMFWRSLPANVDGYLISFATLF
jgi:hypothetical protein